VLNALRHQRFGTCFGRSRQPVRASAQRLTASEVWHLTTMADNKNIIEVLNALRHQRFGTLSPPWPPYVLPHFPSCSTPYGIRGLARSSLEITVTWVYVLNALRHQRFGTRVQQVRRPAARRAQRLTASEVWHSEKPLSLSQRNQCSTPYGIRGLAL